MVFDCHIHVQPWRMMRPEALALMDDAAHQEAKHVISDADSLIRHLDAEGVARACLINYVSPDVMGFGPDVNDWIAGYTSQHRDRLLPVGSVNPLVSPDVAAETRRVLDLGIRMIKLHPPHQRFAPNAYLHGMAELAHLYEQCESRGVPVMVHTGTSIFPRARNVFADPMAVDDVAIDYPGLTLILAHAGRPLYGETATFLARRHPNVHLDLSGIPPRAIPDYVPGFQRIAGKLLWGTDWPSPGVTSMARNIAEFRQLVPDVAVQEMVLSGNANRLFP